ncbi:MAG: hypothetical protein KIC66_02815 [Clostridium sp.]|uniref:Uncharacterized protein n=1 Tax=Clostridium paraputrificum TaxID=29363 RepID=A0A6N3BFK6_9CLOT|nr:hypothetical protein [Clostridium sp.]MBS5926004.1 hypothetical protein [Clostridium sp.]
MRNKKEYNKVISKSSIIQNQIPKFGYKSAFIILATAIFSSILVPSFFKSLGVDTKIITILANSILISLSVCYCQFFIETNKKFNGTFVKVFIALSVGIAVISYFWIYVGLYI